MLSHFSHVPLFVTTWTVVARLLCSWDPPDKSTGVGSRALLQMIFPTQGSNPSLLHLLHWETGSLPLEPTSVFFLENPRDGGAWWAAVYGSHRVGHNWRDAAAAAGPPLYFFFCYCLKKQKQNWPLCLKFSLVQITSSWCLLVYSSVLCISYKAQQLTQILVWFLWQHSHIGEWNTPAERHAMFLFWCYQPWLIID